MRFVQLRRDENRKEGWGSVRLLLRDWLAFNTPAVANIILLVEMKSFVNGKVLWETC